MTIREALQLGYKKTKSTLDSEVLLSHVLEKPREFLLSNQEYRIRNHQTKKFRILLAKRHQGWPVAYLTGKKEFFGLKFIVTKDVLIPRPETETLVERVLSKVTNRAVRILDLGTGSGSIIISLAKKLGGKSKYFASDISEKALAVARKNAKNHKTKISFKKGSLLFPWKNQKFDIIVANLPYLWKLEHPSTRLEPKSALIAGKKGLALYEQLFQQIKKWKNSQLLLAEFDPRQTGQIKNLALKHLPGFEIKIYKDLFGKNRFIQLSLP